MIKPALTLAVAMLLASAVPQTAGACDSFDKVRAMLSGDMYLDEQTGRIFATDPNDSHVPVGEPLGRIAVVRNSHLLSDTAGVALAVIEPSLRFRFVGQECKGYKMQIYPATWDISVVATRGDLIGTITGRLPYAGF